jgi:hypothetical protein
MRTYAFAIAALLLTACAGRTPRPCEPVPADVLTAANQIVYSRCQVDRVARMPARLPAMQYTPRGNCGSVMLQIVINESGRVIPRATRVIRSSDPALADAFQNSLAAARFRPAVKDGVPVAMLDSIGTGYSVVTVRSGGAPPSVSRANAPRC